MGKIVVEKVTDIDDALTSFFDDVKRDEGPRQNWQPFSRRAITPSVEEIKLSMGDAGNVSLIDEGPHALLHTEREALQEEPLSEWKQIELEPWDFVVSEEVVPSQKCSERMAQAITQPHTTLFVARDEDSGKVLATALAVSEGSSYYNPQVVHYLRTLHALEHLDDKAPCPITDSTSILQLECLMTDRGHIGFAMVPALMRAFRQAVQQEMAERKPDIVFALTENEQLAPLLVQLAGKSGMPRHHLHYIDPEHEDQILGLTVAATNADYDLSFLTAHAQKVGHGLD